MLYVRMLVLSIKPIAMVGLDSRISRRVEVKNRNKIGNKVDLCKIPIVCCLSLSTKAPNLS